MKRIIIMTFVTIVAGCTAAQIEQLKADEQTAETTLAATTQATATARASLATQPADAPGHAGAVKVVAASEKGEQTARLALDLANAALTAAQNRDALDPTLQKSLTAIVTAIPSPWTPVLASLVPAALPLVVSVVQSVKLGRAHQTVVHVTEQLQAHKAALDALTSKPSMTVASSVDQVVGLPV